MLGKATRPLILTKLPEPLTTLKCSLEFRILSPRSLKKIDPVVGVGLAIVAALEKSNSGLETARSIPIPINGGKCKYTEKGEDVGAAGHDRSGRGDVCFENSSPPKTGNVLPPLDFMNSCGLCKRKLHGRDIYMYRGEKAFCSAECRCRHIMIEEHKEQCGQELSRSVDMSNSPYSRDNIFFTGIAVA